MSTPPRFTLKEEIVLAVLPSLIEHQLRIGEDNNSARHAGEAAVTIANAAIAALEADE